MQEPPEVTVRDPRRDARPVDLLEADDEPWRPSRRQVTAVAAVAALVAAVAGGRALQERRAQQAEDRRLGAVVQVERALRFGGETITHTLEDTGVVERRVGLRNTGPRAIRVLGAALGSMTLAAPVALAPGDEAPLRLVQSFDCERRPLPLPDVRDVQLRVRTGRGVRDVVLPLGDDQVWDEGQSRRACDYLEPAEAGSVVATASRVVGSKVVVDLEVANSGRDALRLVSLASGTGLGLELRTPQGQPLALPVDLPPRRAAQDPEVLHLQAALSVTDCRAVQPPTGAGFEDGGAGTLAFSVAGATGAGEATATATTGLPDPQPVLDLVARLC